MSSKYDIDFTQQTNSQLPPNKRLPKYKGWVKAIVAAFQWLHDNIFNDYDQGGAYPYYDGGSYYPKGSRVIDIDNAIYEAQGQMRGIQPSLNQNPAASGAIVQIDAFAPGSGYTFATIAIQGDGTGATATATVSGGSIVGYTIVTPGTGYTFANIIITGDGTGATNRVYISSWWQKIAATYIGAQERLKYRGQKLSLEFALNRFFRTTFRQPTAIPDIYIQNNNWSEFFYIGGSDSEGSFFYGGNTTGDGYIINDNTAELPMFTIFVPDSALSPRPGWYTGGINADGFGEEKIRDFADNYVVAGILYNVETY